MLRMQYLTVFFLGVLLLGSPAVVVQADEFNQFKLDLIMAKRGDADAQYSVAAAYEDGAGVKKDLAEAFRWYKSAAAKGHKAAQYKLGYFYENGLYVKKDKRSARSWYELAAMNGDKLAKARLAALKKPKTVPKPAPRPTPIAKPSGSNKATVERKRKQAEQKAREEKARKQREAQARERQRREKEARIRKEQQRKQAAARKQAEKKKKPALPSYDVAALIKAVKQTKWKGRGATDTLLPSAKTTCLISGGKDIICFSREQKAGLENETLTYTTKSTLTDFRSNGRFRLEYMFNVADIQPGSHAGTAPPGMSKTKGWQEPMQVMQCQALSLSRLSCVRNGETFLFEK